MSIRNLEHFIIIASDAQRVRKKMENYSKSSYRLSELNKEMVPGQAITFLDADHSTTYTPPGPYALLIDDEIDALGDFLYAANKSNVLQTMIACKDPLSAKWFLSSVSQKPLFVTLDFNLINDEGFAPITQEIYTMIKTRWPHVPVMGITHHEGLSQPEVKDLETSFRSSKDSVYGKDSINRALANIFRDKYHISLLTEEKDRLVEEKGKLVEEKNKLQENYNEFKKLVGIDLTERQEAKGFKLLAQPLIGSSVKMREIKLHIEIAATHNDNILLLGETGTGKELVAKAIYKLSGERGKLVTVNCAAIPETLIESELFGVIKDYPGFHGNAEKQGLVEEANGGTLFLDEIHHMSLVAQAKLLRIIDDKSYTRLGDTRIRKLDPHTRIIAASKPNIESLITEKKFLEDLYGRLNSFMPVMPTLRERKEDVPELLEYFSDLKKSSFYFTDEAVEILKAQEWKRNVREFRNFIYGIHNLYAGADGNNKNLGALPKKHMIEADHINYALQLFYKKETPEPLFQKILPEMENEAIAQATNKAATASASDLLKAILDAIDTFTGKPQVTLEQLAQKIVMPSTGKTGVNKGHLSAEFGKYAHLYKNLLSTSPYDKRLDTAMRYGPLKRLITQ